MSIDFLPGRLGFGTAPLGNMYRDVPEDEALATVRAAWDHGIRYFDTAPLYGAGLAELRLGRVLAAYPRDEFVVSTKVGRIVLDETEDSAARDLGEKGGLFEHGRPNKIVYDYSADGVRRSIDDSLDRLGLDRIDIAWVHDVSQDFHGDRWPAVYDQARTGAFRALRELRDDGVIRGWGLGVNRVEPLEMTLDLEEPRPDAFLLAGRYTLLDHRRALERLMPHAAERRVDIVIGGPYNSGVTAGGDHFEYQQASPDVVTTVAHIRDLCRQYGISVKAAALQFSLAHPAARAAIPGSTRPGHVEQDAAAIGEEIPPEFWTALRRDRLLEPDVPVPGRS